MCGMWGLEWGSGSGGVIKQVPSGASHRAIVAEGVLVESCVIELDDT